MGTLMEETDLYWLRSLGVRAGDKSRIVGNALLAAVLLALCAGPAQAQAVQDLVRRGIQAYNARQYASAVNNLQAAVSRDPENDTAHYYLGNALMACGNKQHALQEYSRAFQYSMDGEMLDNCARVLEAYRQPLPHRTPRARKSAPGLNPYTTGSVQEMNRLAETHSSQARRAMESHSSSLDVFKNVPENSDGMNRAWDDWILKYRYAFNNVLKTYTGLRRRSGKTRMVFSVSSGGRLRGRIVDTDAPVFLTDAMLATTRKLDGDPGLGFPAGSQIPGFNFTMTYDYGAPEAEPTTAAALRTTSTSASLRNPGGQSAVAGKLSGSKVTSKLTSTETSAALSSKGMRAGLKLPQGERASALGTLSTTGVNGKIGAGSTAAGLSSQMADGLADTGEGSLPTVSTDVSGLLLPKPKMEELKASPAKLLPGKSSSGRVMPKSKNVKKK